MDLLVYSLLKKMVNGVATGLSKVNYDAENKQLVFTCNDSTILRISVPDGVSKKQQEMLSHMTLEQEEETGSYYIAVDGERIGSKTCSFTTSVEVGALKSGTKLENRFFTVFSTSKVTYFDTPSEEPFSTTWLSEESIDDKSNPLEPIRILIFRPPIPPRLPCSYLIILPIHVSNSPSVFAGNLPIGKSGIPSLSKSV